MKISVVIPLYNKAPYIDGALRSVLAQRRQPDEIVVVDDGSTDGGGDIAEAVPGVRVIRQPNGGVAAARNAGFAAASGDLVALLDADDRWDPRLLAEVETAANEHPEAGIICTGYRRKRQDGASTAHFGPAGVVPSFYAQWARGSFTCASAIAVRRSVAASCGVLFPVGERLGEDQDAWFRLAEAAPVVHIPNFLAEYRIDAANNSAGAVRDPLPCYRRLAERLAAGTVPAHEVAGARRLLASHMINIARTRAAAGDKAGARALLWTRQAAGNPLYWLRSLLTVR